MKGNFTRSLLLLSLLFFLSHSIGLAEGTKQLMPTNTSVEKIEVCSPTMTKYGFAYYGCAEYRRLNIHIGQIGEKIYYGFRRNGGTSGQYRIKDPLTAIVVPAANLPTVDNPGYINSWDEAVAGPFQVAGTGGYDALSYTPVMTGDFYIEFSTDITLLYFDITVVDAANVPITGRVWSKAWQFDTGNNLPNDSHQTFYIYTDDGLVSSMNMNGMQGITYTVACNQVGCPNPSGTGYTRASVNGQSISPQYKIFINDPDINEYPTGTLGQLSNPTVTWNCDGSADISFDVTQGGTVDILLDLDPTPGPQPIDTTISTAVVIGHNVIHWNGVNGLGQQVPSGTVFNISITYIMGLTNFPMYDVEQNTNGLKVNLIRPAGVHDLLVYWDDTGLTVSASSGCTATPAPPTSNFLGCNTAEGSCHTWLAVGSGTPSQCSYGNENTVNQYWYAVFTKDTLFQFVEHRAPAAPVFISGTSSLCAGTTGLTYTINNDPSSLPDSYIWEYTGTGVTFNPPNPTGLTATLDFSTSATSGQVRVKGFNNECAYGAWGTYNVTVTPVPQLTNSQDESICSEHLFSRTLVASPATTTFDWTVTCTNLIGCPLGQTGAGAINDILTAAGLGGGTAVYHVTPTAGSCHGDTKSFTVSVDSKPTISSPTGSGESICSGKTTNITLASATFPTAVINWQVKPGDCSNIATCPTSGTGGPIQSLLTLQDPSLPGSVKYTITPAIGDCIGDDVPYTVTVLRLPDVTLNDFNPVCLNTPTFTLTGGNPAGGIYKLSGTPVTTFNPAAYGVGSYPITYTYTDGNGCVNVTNSKDIVVQDIVTAPVNGNSQACKGVGETYSTTPGMTSSSYTWSVTPDGTISGAGPDTKTITWSTTGTKTITVSYTDPNGCSTIPGTKTVEVKALPVPTISGQFVNICNNKQYTYTTQGGMSNYSWNVSAGNTLSFTGNSATVTWITVSPNEWIEVNYVNADGCTSVSPVRYTVAVDPSPVFLVNGPAGICAGSSGTFSLESAYVGDWSISGGATLVPPVTGVHSVTVNCTSTTSPATATLTVNYQNVYGCPGITTKNITINPLPVASYSTTTPSPVCQDYPVASLYSVDAGGPVATYLWQVIPVADASILNATANPASITWKLLGTAQETAQLSLTATTGSGCVSSTSQSVTINPKPIVQMTPCFDRITTKSAKRFLLKGGTPVFPLKGEYLITPSTTAFTSDGSGNYYFDPSQAAVNTYNLTYRYTNQNGCINTTTSPVSVVVQSAPSMTCGPTMTDPRDGKIYAVATISGHCWMTENLNYNKNSAPTDIATGQTDNCVAEKYCPESTCAHGGYYQWNEVTQYAMTDMPYQGLCPPGWHVPTEAEWQYLVDHENPLFTGTSANGLVGTDLKDQAKSFKGVLEGVNYLNHGTWTFASGTPTATMFWTSTLDGSGKAVARGLNNPYNQSVSRYPSSPANAFPVRCMRDN